MIYYPDTTLPPSEFPYGITPLIVSNRSKRREHPRASPRRGCNILEKKEKGIGFVGFNGFCLNIIKLNQPNANTMPISREHRLLSGK